MVDDNATCLCVCVFREMFAGNVDIHQFHNG